MSIYYPKEHLDLIEKIRAQQTKTRTMSNSPSPTKMLDTQEAQIAARFSNLDL